MMSVEERVKNIIAEQLGVAVEKIVPEARFKEGLGAGSLDSAELLLKFEDEFRLDILDEDAEKMLRVGDVIKYIKEKAGN